MSADMDFIYDQLIFINVDHDSSYLICFFFFLFYQSELTSLYNRETFVTLICIRIHSLNVAL